MAVGFSDLARVLGELSYLRAAMYSFDGEFGTDAVGASSGSISVDVHGNGPEEMRGPALLSADGSMGDVMGFASYLNDTAFGHRGISPELLIQVSDFVRNVAEVGPGSWARSVTMARLLSEAHVRMREEGADRAAIERSLALARERLGVTGEDLARLALATEESRRPLSDVSSAFHGIEPADDAFTETLVGMDRVELWNGGAVDGDGQRLDFDFVPDPPRSFADFAVEVAEAMGECSDVAGVGAARGVAADVRGDLSSGMTVAVYDDYGEAEKALADRLSELRLEAAADGVSDESFASRVAMGHAGWLYREATSMAGKDTARRRAARMALAVALIASGDVDLDDAMAEVADGAVECGAVYDADVFLKVSRGLSQATRMAVICGATPEDVARSVASLSALAGNSLANDRVLESAGLLDEHGAMRPSDRIRVMPGRGEVLPELIAEAGRGL